MIKLIRLTTGEEVLCTAKVEENGLTISDPALLVPTEKGIGLMDMMPYSKMGEEETFIENQFIMFVTEPIEGLRKQYQASYSKIITPEKKLII